MQGHRKNLYQYAILYHPPTTKDAQGNDTTAATEIVKEISSVLAKDENEVSIMAARQIPERFLDKLEGIDIIVTPFFRP